MKVTVDESCDIHVWLTKMFFLSFNMEVAKKKMDTKICNWSKKKKVRKDKTTKMQKNNKNPLKSCLEKKTDSSRCMWEFTEKDHNMLFTVLSHLLFCPASIRPHMMTWVKKLIKCFPSLKTSVLLRELYEICKPACSCRDL